MSVTPIIGCFANLPRPDYEPQYIKDLQRVSEMEVAAARDQLTRSHVVIAGGLEAMFRDLNRAVRAGDANQIAVAVSALEETTSRSIRAHSEHAAYWVLARCVCVHGARHVG